MGRRHVGSRVVLTQVCWILVCASGCTVPEVPVSLSYSLADNEKVAVSLAGVQFGLVPFRDTRTDKYIYGKHLVLAEGQDAGVWVANALKLEMEHAGAEVVALPAATSPSSGRQVGGQVAVLKSEGTGWAPGGILGAIVGTGYQPQIVLSVQLTDEGVPLLSRQFDLKRNVPSNPAAVWLFGRPPPVDDVPPAFAVVLKELIREQILPEIAKCVRSDEPPPAAGGQP